MDDPHRLLLFKLGHFSRKATTLERRRRAATCNRLSSLDPLPGTDSRRKLTTSLQPNLTARCKGVAPSGPMAFWSAPDSIKKRTMSESPHLTASRKGVSPSHLAAFESASDSISKRRTTSIAEWSPQVIAKCKGNAPASVGLCSAPDSSSKRITSGVLNRTA